MPPHCDSMDGPVVTAARRALRSANVDLVLPFVPREGEPEVKRVFGAVCEVRALGPRARELADLQFLETVVRLHRAGEGAPYTGLKPAGLDVGPVIPAAERAIEEGTGGELTALLGELIREETQERLAHVMELKAEAGGDVERQREYVGAMLGFQVWAHHVYKALSAPAHEHHQVVEPG